MTRVTFGGLLHSLDSQGMGRKTLSVIAWGAGLALVCQLAVSFLLHSSSLRSRFPSPEYLSISFADILVTILLWTAAALFFLQARRETYNRRRFWLMMSAGCVIWSMTWAIWIWHEVIHRAEVPTPSIADVILFFHLVPFM